MSYCAAYEDRQNVVGAAGFQQGQAGYTLAQFHAVQVTGSSPASLAACGVGYNRLDLGPTAST